MSNYIDSRFKRDFIIRLCLGMVLIAMLCGIIFVLILPAQTANFYFSLISSFEETKRHLLPILAIVGLFEIILASLFTLLLALFLSHKVGGPIFKLGQNIEKLKAGDLGVSAISFRAKDQGQILADRFNEMRNSWHGHLSELMENYGNFSERMKGLTEDCLAGRGLVDLQAIAGIKHDVEKMQNVLDRFHI